MNFGVFMTGLSVPLLNIRMALTFKGQVFRSFLLQATFPIQMLTSEYAHLVYVVSQEAVSIVNLTTFLILQLPNKSSSNAIFFRGGTK